MDTEDAATALEAITDQLPPGLGDDGTAAAAAVAGESEIEGLTVEEAVRKVHQAQVEQAQLIQALLARQSELENEVADLKNGQWVVKASPTPRRAAPKRVGGAKAVEKTAEALVSVGAAAGAPEFACDDDEIDAIMESRRQRKAWPLKRKYVLAFSNEEELVKIRLHRSERHSHKCVRIPKVDKNEGEGYGIGNKEGRLICRLCSGKASNRNTSWMCATCCVPLCVDLAEGDPETSCHARWHNCRDLVALNAELNHALKAKREDRKRSREEEAVAGGAELEHVEAKMEPVEQEALAQLVDPSEVPAPVLHHAPIDHVVEM